MSHSLIQSKFIEVPTGINIQDKMMFLNIWISDMQRNGINILSTSQLQRHNNPDGTFIEGFTVEFRESDLVVE